MHFLIFTTRFFNLKCHLKTSFEHVLFYSLRRVYLLCILMRFFISFAENVISLQMHQNAYFSTRFFYWKTVFLIKVSEHVFQFMPFLVKMRLLQTLRNGFLHMNDKEYTKISVSNFYFLLLSFADKLNYKKKYF